MPGKSGSVVKGASAARTYDGDRYPNEISVRKAIELAVSQINAETASEKKTPPLARSLRSTARTTFRGWNTQLNNPIPTSASELYRGGVPPNSYVGSKTTNH